MGIAFHKKFTIVSNQIIGKLGLELNTFLGFLWLVNSNQGPTLNTDFELKVQNKKKKVFY